MNVGTDEGDKVQAPLVHHKVTYCGGGGGEGGGGRRREGEEENT